MKTETLQFDTAGGATTAYAAMPDETNENTRGVVLIQEWWGLNEHIKDICNRYAAEGFIAVAPDLYRGKLAGNPSEASAMMQALKIEDGIDTIKNAVAKARETYGLNKLGISGYCMGGTFSLRAACELEDFGAAAPFYGDIPPEDVLKNLKTPTLFIAGAKDAWINAEKVGELKRVATEYNLPVETVVYEADHAFFNNTRPEVYDPAASLDAWGRVLDLFRKHL